MRLRLLITPEKGRLKVPIHYNHLVQGFIYRHIEEPIADWLHSKGFSYHSRNFKLFTFSWLFGEKRLLRQAFEFKGNISFYFSTPVEEILDSFVKKLLKAEYVELANSKCYIEKVEVEPLRSLSSYLYIRMLSPVTVYSTFLQGDKKKTYYYNPHEKDFERLVLENIRKKVMAYYGEGEYPSLDGAYFKPVDVNESNFHIIKFKGFVIKGWSGIYRLHLPEPYLSMAYDAGLGSKNSQGFGMWEVLKEVNVKK
ncbi:MAG: CRISPR-associated endoribonuclease Cas6 [candidate division WOR-3 bacterium]